MLKLMGRGGVQRWDDRELGRRLEYLEWRVESRLVSGLSNERRALVSRLHSKSLGTSHHELLKLKLFPPSIPLSHFVPFLHPLTLGLFSSTSYTNLVLILQRSILFLLASSNRGTCGVQIHRRSPDA